MRRKQWFLLLALPGCVALEKQSQVESLRNTEHPLERKQRHSSVTQKSAQSYEISDEKMIYGVENNLDRLKLGAWTKILEYKDKAFAPEINSVNALTEPDPSFGHPGIAGFAKLSDALINFIAGPSYYVKMTSETDNNYIYLNVTDKFDISARSFGLAGKDFGLCAGTKDEDCIGQAAAFKAGKHCNDGKFDTYCQAANDVTAANDAARWSADGTATAWCGVSGTDHWPMMTNKFCADCTNTGCDSSAADANACMTQCSTNTDCDGVIYNAANPEATRCALCKAGGAADAVGFVGFPYYVKPRSTDRCFTGAGNAMRKNVMIWIKPHAPSKPELTPCPGISAGDRFLQIGNWRIADVNNNYLSVAFGPNFGENAEGNTTVQYFLSTGGVQVAPTIDPADTTLDLVASSSVYTLPTFGENFIQIGRWRIADVGNDTKLSVAAGAAGSNPANTAQVYTKEGVAIDGPNPNDQVFDKKITATRTTPNYMRPVGVFFGDRVMFIGRWQIAEVDGSSLSISHQNGHTAIVFKSDGSVMKGPRWDYDSCYTEETDKNYGSILGGSSEAERCLLRYTTLDAAKGACSARSDCKGVTMDNGQCGKQYELRGGTLSDWSGMTSWTRGQCMASQDYDTWGRRAPMSCVVAGVAFIPPTKSAAFWWFSVVPAGSENVIGPTHMICSDDQDAFEMINSDECPQNNRLRSRKDGRVVGQMASVYNLPCGSYQLQDANFSSAMWAPFCAGGGGTEWLDLTGRAQTASMSSTAYPSNTAGSAAVAVDRNTAGNWGSVSCTHTHHNTNPWWEIDMGEDQAVVSIQVINRADCCQSRLRNVYAEIDGVRCQPSINLVNYGQVGWDPYPIMCGLVGKTLRVGMEHSDPFTLCEVMVYTAIKPPQEEESSLLGTSGGRRAALPVPERYKSSTSTNNSAVPVEPRIRSVQVSAAGLMRRT